MKIVQYRGEYPNFGDELNEWLWPKLLPNFFDEDTRTLFIGIGSTLGDAHDTKAKKIVFGAGFVPSYHPKPEINEDWNIYFVRGPRTAAQLNLPADYAISDAGILLRQQVDLAKKTNEQIAFMPHWQSLSRGHWEAVCACAGLRLIDPRQPVDVVIAELLRSKLVIAEAMHGAIIADAFRIPYVPVLPLNQAHRDKWYDWSESLGIQLRPQRLWPSSLAELGRSSFNMQIGQTATVSAERVKPSLLSRAKRQVQDSGFAPWVDARIIDLAAHRLRQLAQAPVTMSSDAALDRALARMQEKLEQLRTDYAA